MRYFHVWFTTKYRKAILDDKVENKIKSYFLEVAQNKKYNILEMETDRDHAHMLLEAKDKNTLSNMVRILKCVSAKKILEEYTPRLRVGNGNSGFYRRKPVEERSGFWARRYGFREIDDQEVENIKEYIRNHKGKYNNL